MCFFPGQTAIYNLYIYYIRRSWNTFDISSGIKNYKLLSSIIQKKMQEKVRPCWRQFGGRRISGNGTDWRQQKFRSVNSVLPNSGRDLTILIFYLWKNKIKIRFIPLLFLIARQNLKYSVHLNWIYDIRIMVYLEQSNR